MKTPEKAFSLHKRDFSSSNDGAMLEGGDDNKVQQTAMPNVRYKSQQSPKEEDKNSNKSSYEMVSVTDSEEEAPKVGENEEVKKQRDQETTNFLQNTRIGQSIEKSHQIRKCLTMKSLIQFFSKVINPKQIKYGNFEPITINKKSFNHVIFHP